MKDMRILEILAATSGNLLYGNPEALAQSITTDTRTLKKGAAYFPLIGERFDGHDFLGDAIEGGAAVVLSDRESAGILTHAKRNGVAFIKVENTMDALHALATYYRKQFDIPIIAVTGSTGKTSTKEMLYWILSERYNTTRNLGNYNNLIGLPLSIFQIDEETEAAVFEMGMDRLGEIQTMVEIASPSVCIITNIGHSHLERLGSRANILTAKMEIASRLTEGQTLILNDDNDVLKELKVNGVYQILRVGKTDDADFKISDIVDRGEAGIHFQISSKTGDSTPITLGLPGVHNAWNAGMAAAASYRLGIDLKTASEGLNKVTTSVSRLNVIEVQGIKVIDDTYNASPDSMRVALDVLKSIDGRRKIAILGDMFELGAEEEILHRGVGEYAAQSGIDMVISVGKNARHISDGASGVGETQIKTFHFEEKELLKAVLQQWLRDGDVILVKGSRGMEMDQIIEMLRNEK